MCHLLVLPLPPRFIGYPPEDGGSGVGDAALEALDLPTRLIWALTCDSWRSYSHAA